MDAAVLEDYIRTAGVVHACPLNGGGGHQGKQLVILEGGLGVVAKLAEGTNATQYLQIRAECGAWLLAQELDWTDLVPMTAFRVVRSIFTENYVAASVQIAWPLFKVAAECGPRHAKDCPDDEIWRVAIFDALALNTDRHGMNWGFVEQMDDRPKLIDHGHAFEAATARSFDFIDLKQGQKIPAENLARVELLLSRRLATPLADVLPTKTFEHVMDRAKAFVDTGDFSV
jgi:hypothetical protein